MLDIPATKSVVSFSDLAKFNVSTFGADAIIRHLTAGGDAVMPVLPNESIFLSKFWRTVAQHEEVENDEEPCGNEAEEEDSGSKSNKA